MELNENLHQHRFLLPFERDFDLNIYGVWLKNHLLIPIVLGILYVAFVTNGPQFMEKRQPFKLYLPVIVWNMAFALLNTVATIRMLPLVIDTLVNDGFQYSICNPKGFTNDPVFGFWICVLSIAKAVQLLDGAILVFRRKDVPFVHCYKHFLELYVAAFPAIHVPSVGRWIMTLNTLNQSIISTYLVFRSMNYKISPKIPMVILALQILEKVVLTVVGWHVYVAVHNGDVCDMNRPFSKMLVAWQGTSSVLYAVYFYQKYLAPPESTEKKEI